jgi:hypothetical protein
MEVCTAFQKMIQDLNAILGIPANAEIVDKENPKSGIVLQLLGILGHVVPGKPEQFIHHIAVVMAYRRMKFGQQSIHCRTDAA